MSAPARLELFLRPPAPLDADDGVVGAVPDRDRRQRALEVEREALDGRDEPAQGEDAGRTRPVRAEPEGIAHHRALGEAADHGSFRRDAEPVQPGRGALVAGPERLGVREAELAG